jgi:hypothetical protein
MKTVTLLSTLLATAAAHTIGEPSPQYIFDNPDVHDEELRIPSVRESAAMARKIMHLTTIGNLVTVFPEQKHSELSIEENRPSDVGGSPIGLMGERHGRNVQKHILTVG